jgi:RecG-like helicase
MSDTPFIIHSPFQPMGDQPQAIDELSDGLEARRRHQVLLGATGTGKTFTIANVISRANKPTLLISHNTTLAAQLESPVEFVGQIEAMAAASGGRPVSVSTMQRDHAPNQWRQILARIERDILDTAAVTGGVAVDAEGGEGGGDRHGWARGAWKRRGRPKAPPKYRRWIGLS